MVHVVVRQITKRVGIVALRNTGKVNVRKEDEIVTRETDEAAAQPSRVTANVASKLVRRFTGH